MKVTLLQENLRIAIMAANRFTASKPQLPVLGNILLQAIGNEFFLMATNLDTGIRIRVGAKVLAEGAITVPGKTLGDFVGSLSAGAVTLEKKEEGLELTSGKFSATFQGIGAAEFPEFPKKEDGVGGEFDRSLLTEVSERVAFAASNDESRPTLTGVFWQWGSGLEVVATDGYRLGLLQMREIRWKSLKQSEVGWIVPVAALKEVEKVFGEYGQEKISFTWSNTAHQLFFSGGEVEIAIRLLEGEFPNYKTIIPRKGEIEVSLNKSEVLQAVRAAAIFARDAANIVRWKFVGSRLEISANSPNSGKSLSSVEILKREVGGDGAIAFNSRFLLDVVSRIVGETFTFFMIDSLKPGVFVEEEKGKKFLALIMPVRVSDEA